MIGIEANPVQPEPEWRVTRTEGRSRHVLFGMKVSNSKS